PHGWDRSTVVGPRPGIEAALAYCARHPERQIGHLLLGRLRAVVRDDAAARRQLELAIDLRPPLEDGRRRSAGWFFLASELQRAGDLRGAEKALGLAIEQGFDLRERIQAELPRTAPPFLERPPFKR